MTITTTTARNDYTGAGSTGPYAYTFRIFAATDLLVVTRNTSTGVETPLAYVTDYSVTGVGEGAGGTITLTSALAVGYTMAITRVVPIVQDTDLRNQGTFYPQTYENALDYLTAIDQQQEDAIERSLKVGDAIDPATFNTVISTVPAGSYLRVNTDGDGFEAATGDANATTYTASGAGAVVRTVTSKLSDFVNVKDYGAAGLGADYTAAIQAAVVAAGEKTLYFPAGTYTLSSVITVAASHQKWTGDDGATLTWTTCGNVSFGAHFGTITAAINVTGEDFGIEKLTLVGPTAAGTYTAGQMGIAMRGTSTSTRLTGCLLQDMTLRNFGANGVIAQFVDRMLFRNVRVIECGYAGIALYSCNSFRVWGGRISTIGPGEAGDCYGFSASHDSTGYSGGGKAATNPFCWDGIVDGLTVANVATTGIDAHGGYELSYINNKVFGCKRAIQLAGGSGDATGYAGYDNLIGGNICDAANEDGTASGNEWLGAGIEFGGGATGKTWHDGVLVTQNTVRGYGNPASAESAAIRGIGTINTGVLGNTILNWKKRAIIIDARDNRVDGNQIGALTAGAGVSAIETLTSGSGTLVVIDNTLTADSGTAAAYGFRYSALTSRPTISGNDFSAATTAQTLPSSAGLVRGTDYPNVMSHGNGSATVDIGTLTAGTVGVVKVSNAATITAINSGTEGQVITLVVSGNVSVTLTAGATLKLAGGSNVVMNQYDTVTLVLFGTTWCQVATSANA